MLNLEIVVPEEAQAKKDFMNVGGSIMPLQIEGQNEEKAVDISEQPVQMFHDNYGRQLGCGCGYRTILWLERL